MRIIFPLLVILWSCSAGRPSLPDPRAEAEEALSRAAKLKAVAWGPADSVALGELVKARLAARAAGRSDLEIQALNEMGALEFRRDRIAQATRAFELALAEARRRSDRAGQAAALNGIGDLYLERGFVAENENEKAMTAYQDALTLARAIPDSVLEGKALFNLGNAYQARRDLESSLEYYRLAYDLQDRAGDLAGRRLTERGLADLYYEREEPEKALRTLRRALAESRAARDLGAALHISMSMGSVQLGIGEYEDAVESFEEALRLGVRVGSPLREAYARVQLATANSHLGELERAALLYRQAIDLYEREARVQGLGLPRLLAFPLVFLGSQIQPEIGFDAAETRYYRQALDLVEERYTGADDRVRTTVFHFYGRALNDAGRPRQALHYLELAEPSFRGPKAKSYWARTQLELGKAHLALGDFVRARSELASALATSRNLGDFLLEAVTYHEIARLERDLGRLHQAVEASTASLGIIDEIRSRVASRQLRTSFFASRQVYYRFQINLLMELHRRDPLRGHDRAAFEVSERARARVLLDLLAEGRIDITEAIPASLKNREQEIGRRLSRLESRLFRGQSDAALEEALARSEEERRQLEDELRRQSPRYAEILHPVIRDVDDVQGLLDDRTAFLEFTFTEGAVFLFVVTRDAFQSFRLPLTPEEVAEGVRALRRDLLDKANPYGFLLHAGNYHELYRGLLGEAATGILSAKSNWLIAADGPLLLLNFEVLPTRPPTGEPTFDQAYLLRERTLHFVPSASVMAEILARRSSPPSAGSPLELFAIADPTLSAGEDGTSPGRKARQEFPPLVEARREVEGIAELYPKERRVVYQGAKATEGLVKGLNGGFRHARRVHLATHGTFDEHRPESSALLLAPGPAGEDGRLTVAEIFNLRVDAELVVLSACNTGQGKQVAGEGLVGMSRAFFYAGAPTLVVSLWPADDVTTAKLMTSFYRNMEAVRDKAEALRRAKLELASKVSPYYWAPFILVGDAAENGEP